MANMARADQEKRTVEVKRSELVHTLIANRVKHVKDYEDAMAGYTAVLLAKIDEAFAAAQRSLSERHGKMKEQVAGLSEEDIAQRSDRLVIVDSICVEMKVPRSYKKEYDAAIDMAQWDVRDTLELTHAEFTCFVRDEWDWKSGFDAVSMLYKSIG